MSDINGDNHRVRRRAVRSVGPPVEEDDGPSGVTAVNAEKVPAAAGVTAAARTGGVDAVEKVGSDAGEKAASKSVGGYGDVVADTTTKPWGVAAKSVVTAKKPPSTAESKAGEADESDDTDTPVDLTKSDADATVEKPKRRVGRVVTVVAAAVLVLLTVVGAGTSIFLVHTTNVRDERRAEYVQTARQAVLNLTTIRADSAKADIDRILSLASGQFKTEFDGRVDPFMSIVQQAKVVSNGEVVEAAIQQDDENSAQVLVAAKQTLSNAGQAEPQTRYYRFRVTVSRGDTGLTASKVEFVA
ncbi:hypothetical protein OG225_37125 [Nocardia sp. NBC_01377]|uniref:hypothetical protein n=1 Tax=Nocardia sp. NBC_01377 TaxID=2903595 RepID=UPI0032461A2C